MDSAWRSKLQVIALLDMDSFEVQVYQQDRRYQYTKGHPCIVVNDMGRIVAVSPEAKRLNISREMRKKDAVNMVPKLIVIQKDQEWGRNETSKVRQTSKQIISVIKQFIENQASNRIVLEVASCDEFFLDFTKEVNYRQKRKETYPLDFTHNPNVFLEERKQMYRQKGLQYRIDVVHPNSEKPDDYEDEERLLYGAQIAVELNAWISKRMNMTCSIGISYNKFLAKLGCPIRKPNGICVFSKLGFMRVSKKIKIADVPSLGATFGEKLVNEFGVTHLADFRNISVGKLYKGGLSTAEVDQVVRLANGHCYQAVLPREVNDSISCSKTGLKFPLTDPKLMMWLENLGGDLLTRLNEERGRKLKSLNLAISAFRRNGCNLNVQLNPITVYNKYLPESDKYRPDHETFAKYMYNLVHHEAKQKNMQECIVGKMELKGVYDQSECSEE